MVVLTYSGWQRMGSNAHIVGKMLGGLPIVGVAPSEFTGSLFGINGDIVKPLTTYYTQEPRRRHDLLLLARLKPGVTRSQALAEMTLMSARLAGAYPKDDKDRTALVTRATLLPPAAIPTTELLIAILLVIVLLVLLIACANVANLLLALAVGRRHEATIKLALGSSRWRLVREFLAESVIVCGASGIVGYFLAEAAIRRYSKIAVDIPGVGGYSVGLKLHLGFTVVAAAIALMSIAILSTGLPAALYASSPNLSQVLSGEIVVGGTRKAARRNALVIVQVAFCTLVLVGTGLCERSLYNLRHVDPGFTAHNLISESLFPENSNSSAEQRKALYVRVRDLISEIPGVEAVTIARDLPFFSSYTTPVRLPGENTPTPAMSTVADENYFSTFGIALLAGRTFSASDTSRETDSVIVNRKLAETFWPGQDAIGRVLLTGDPPRKAVVIGVAADSKYADLSEAPQSFVYYALSQHYDASMTAIVRTAGDPRLWIGPLSRAVAGAGFSVELLQPVTLGEAENLSLFPERMIAAIVSGLSALGLLLAVVGLFGAISYSVSERKKELGIRVALGAGPWQLLKMIFRQTLLVAGAGTAIGIALGIVATILLRSQFFGIGMIELSVLIPTAVVMLALSLLVAYLSARPWIKVDPMEAVRHA